MTVFSVMKASAAAAIFASAAATEVIAAPTHREFEMLALLNNLRAKGHTCPNGDVFEPNPVPLKWDCALWRASRAHVEDMTANNFFSHEGSDGSSPGDRARRFDTTFSNENIAAGKEEAEEAFQQWVDSQSGHCRGMMNPEHKSMAAAYEFSPLTQYWSYWAQMTGFNEPDPSLQDCLNEDGSLPPLPPTPPPTNFPTVAAEAVEADELMDFQPSSYEMEVLRLINEARAEGNKEECWGEFYTDLEPLEWNCGLFKSARHQMWDNIVHDDFDRTGSDGKSFAERNLDYGVPYSCSDFKLSGRDDTTTSPRAIVDRLISCCCWAVFGPSYKSLGTAHARKEVVDHGFPYRAWWVLFNRHSPPKEVQTCGGAQAPVPEPTPAPTAEPTAAPVEAPTEPVAPGPLACSDFSEKKDCKKQSDCCWKKDCKEKTTICPKQGTDAKCAKFGCTWDAESENCDWVPAE